MGSSAGPQSPPCSGAPGSPAHPALTFSPGATQPRSARQRVWKRRQEAPPLACEHAQGHSCTHPNVCVRLVPTPLPAPLLGSTPSSETQPVHFLCAAHPLLQRHRPPGVPPPLTPRAGSTERRLLSSWPPRAAARGEGGSVILGCGSAFPESVRAMAPALSEAGWGQRGLG